MTKIEKKKIKLWLKNLKNEEIDFMDFIVLLKGLTK